MWNSSYAKFFQFGSRSNFLQANSMQHTATTKQHSSDNIEPCNKHSTFIISFFCHTRPALGVPRLPTIERAALQPRAASCPVHGQHSEHLPFCEAPVRKFLPGPPGAIHGPWSHYCYAAPATEFPRHWTTRSPAPFARTIPSANETVTTMLSQVSRVRHLNQTFCMQIMLTSKHVHRQSLSFPGCPPRTKAATQTKFQKCTSWLPSSPSLQLKQPSSTHCQRGCYQSSILSRCQTVLHCHAKHKSILAELNFQCNRSMSTDSPYRAWNNHKTQSPKNQCKTISTEKRCHEHYFQGISAFTWGSDQTILL